jgi:peptidoglycan/xylan/chitin deacetylase (PgdA/CDA1 family)
LKKHNTTATFFVIGNYIKKNDSDHKILTKIIEENHEMDNHMLDNAAAIFLPQEELEYQINETQKIIESIVPMKKYFRSGCGFFNQKMIQLVEKLGYKLVIGNIYPHDPQIRIPNHHIHYIMSRLEPESIIILQSLQHNIQTLDLLLNQIKNEGYEIVKLSTLLNQ